MKLDKVELDHIAKKTADNLLCIAGLKNAKKVSVTVRRLLLAEDKRRKTLEGKK